jgi:hypothetical protein
MPSSGMLCSMALVITDVSEECSATIIIHSISAQRESVASYGLLFLFTDSSHPEDGGTTFLRNVGSYKSHAT